MKINLSSFFIASRCSLAGCSTKAPSRWPRCLARHDRYRPPENWEVSRDVTLRRLGRRGQAGQLHRHGRLTISLTSG
jgi:hypothetical protein